MILTLGTWARQMKEAAFVCGLLSGLLGVFSAVAFLNGATSVPWSQQTWSGETPAEQAIRAKAAQWNKVGIVAMLAAFGLSAVASVAGYLS